MSRLRLPPPLRPRPPYTPRCVCDTIFPQAMVAGPGSKPSACRYIQRCAFSKEVTQAKLIFAVGSVTAKAKGTGPNDSESPQAPSLRATRGRNGPCIATASSCLARSHFTSNSRKSLMEKEPLTVTQNSCLNHYKPRIPRFRQSGLRAPPDFRRRSDFRGRLYLPPCNAPFPPSTSRHA